MATKEKMTAEEIEANLAHFSGTDNYYKVTMFGNMVVTDGVKFLCEAAGIYWLMDIISTEYRLPKLRPAGDFMVWKMTLNKKGNGAKITVDDGNGNILYTKRIDYTDFPLKEIKFYLETGYTDKPVMVLMLPSER